MFKHTQPGAPWFQIIEYGSDKSGVLPDPHPARCVPRGINHRRAFGPVGGEIREMYFESIDVLASRRYTYVMKANQKRATIYLDTELHRALRLKAAESDCSISALVNAAVRSTLAEDVEDLAAFEDRAHEPNLRFEDVLEDLRQRAKI